ncbi:unnamed protein product [Paramecium primaurelia]|uniref:Uncharacterized protein n=1 Tax=Paramecium primaurelia TaxID=5886 RepID=A0A8S1LN84_PARPR|nr:unnamed protein product [Paramecium primaurelia]
MWIELKDGLMTIPKQLIEANIKMVRNLVFGVFFRKFDEKEFKQMVVDFMMNQVMVLRLGYGVI